MENSNNDVIKSVFQNAADLASTTWFCLSFRYTKCLVILSVRITQYNSVCFNF